MIGDLGEEITGGMMIVLPPLPHLARRLSVLHFRTEFLQALEPTETRMDPHLELLHHYLPHPPALCPHHHLQAHPRQLQHRFPNSNLALMFLQ